jgi:DNA-binding transcriptional regulator YiaG
MLMDFRGAVQQKLITLALSVSRTNMRAAAKLARPEWATRTEKLRERLNLTQTEFARLLDVSAMAISRWERGINEPPAEAYIQLGKMAGSPDCWFFWERAGLSKSDVKRALEPQ